MLQTNTVYPGTLDVLKSIMAADIFTSFTLVGGTALSLQMRTICNYRKGQPIFE